MRHIMKAENRQRGNEKWQEREKDMIERSVAHWSYQPCFMPSPSSQMSSVRLSVWHWYGSTSLWHKLLLTGHYPATDQQHSPPPPPPTMSAFLEASSASLRFRRWLHHLIKICWFSLPAIYLNAPEQNILSMAVREVDRWWTTCKQWIYFLMQKKSFSAKSQLK